MQEQLIKLASVGLAASAGAARGALASISGSAGRRIARWGGRGATREDGGEGEVEEGKGEREDDGDDDGT